MCERCTLYANAIGSLGGELTTVISKMKQSHPLLTRKKGEAQKASRVLHAKIVTSQSRSQSPPPHMVPQKQTDTEMQTPRVLVLLAALAAVASAQVGGSCENGVGVRRTRTGADDAREWRRYGHSTTFFCRGHVHGRPKK